MYKAIALLCIAASAALSVCTISYAYHAALEIKHSKEARAKIVREMVLLENRITADIYEPVALTED